MKDKTRYYWPFSYCKLWNDNIVIMLTVFADNLIKICHEKCTSSDPYRNYFSIFFFGSLVLTSAIFTVGRLCKRAQNFWSQSRKNLPKQQIAWNNIELSLFFGLFSTSFFSFYVRHTVIETIWFHCRKVPFLKDKKKWTLQRTFLAIISLIFWSRRSCVHSFCRVISCSSSFRSLVWINPIPCTWRCSERMEGDDNKNLYIFLY